MIPDNRISRIVALFGSHRQCAELVGTTAQATYHWCNENRVSSQMIPFVILGARRLDPPVKLTPNDFFPEDLR
jgi:hypothetical protein